MELGAEVLQSPHDAYGQRMAVLADLDGHAVCLTHPQPGEGR